MSHDDYTRGMGDLTASGFYGTLGALSARRKYAHVTDDMVLAAIERLVAETETQIAELQARHEAERAAQEAAA
jgi:hypothetical protein